LSNPHAAGAALSEEENRMYFQSRKYKLCLYTFWKVPNFDTASQGILKILAGNLWVAAKSLVLGENIRGNGLET